MKDLLELLLREGAEELRLLTNHAPVMVAHGKALAIDVPALTADNVTELLQSIASEQQIGELRSCGDVHFIYVFQNSARLAVSAALQHETLELRISNLGR